MFKRALPLAMIAALAAQPVQAGPFGTYGLSDSNTTGTFAQGRVGIDLRLLYTTPGDTLGFPALGLVYGLTDRIEIGLLSSLNFAGIGTTAPTTTVDAILPYVKARFNDGPVSVAILVGGITPVRGPVAGTIGGDLIVTWKPDPVIVDLNVGFGRTYNPGANLFHGDVAIWIPVTASLTFCGEGFVTRAFDGSTSTTSLNAHGGLTYAFNPQMTGDVSLNVGKVLEARGFIWTPQVGVTFTI